MFKKFLVLATAVVLASVLSACGGTSEASTEKSAGDISLDGVWKSSKDPQMTATIADGTITIDWTSDDVSMLYWKGTFPKASQEGTAIASSGDTEAMSKSLLGSQDDMKTFTLEKGELTFPFQVMGVKQTVRLKR